MNQPAPRRLTLMLVAIATLCALATFVAIVLVANRGTSAPAASTGPESFSRQILVNGVLITLNTDPSQSYILLSETGAGLLPESAQPTPLATLPPGTPLPTVPPPTPLPPTPAAEPVIFIDYVVQPGDTLYAIALANNSAIELMALHGIDANDLTAGNVLRLPIANPAYCPGARPYVVRDHDTVFDIAAQFNTTAEVIAQMNGLGPDYAIRATQVLCVPA